MILLCVTVSLQDIHMRKAFKSSVVYDQQVVSRDTMPTAMLETYQTCDKPPPLDKLNSYRLVSAYNRKLVAESVLLMCVCSESRSVNPFLIIYVGHHVLC